MHKEVRRQYKEHYGYVLFMNTLAGLMDGMMKVIKLTSVEEHDTVYISLSTFF